MILQKVVFISKDYQTTMYILNTFLNMLSIFAFFEIPGSEFECILADLTFLETFSFIFFIYNWLRTTMTQGSYSSLFKTTSLIISVLLILEALICLFILSFRLFLTSQAKSCLVGFAGLALLFLRFIFIGDQEQCESKDA